MEFTLRNQMKKFAPNDMRTSTIQELFFQHMKKLTMKANNIQIDSFDYQFSDRWLPKRAVAETILRLSRVTA